jgi:hypothetical protein
MRYCLYILFLLTSNWAWAQIGEPNELPKRVANKQEIKILAHLADSFLTELKNLYKKEQLENSPRKYQSERIALVRNYLLIFETLENNCSVVQYTSADVALIFGKPDTIVKHQTTKIETEWLYGKLQTKYVRINNLRYRFYFRNNMLDAVRRDEF